MTNQPISREEVARLRRLLADETSAMRAMQESIRPDGANRDLLDSYLAASRVVNVQMRQALPALLDAADRLAAPTAAGEAGERVLPREERLAAARDAAAKAFDERAKAASHPAVVAQNRHHADVIRAGEGDGYDAVVAAFFALSHPTLKGPTNG